MTMAHVESDTIAAVRALLAGLVVISACTKPNPLFCAADDECASGFCDTTGEFGGTSNACIPIPEDCPVERCGCTPNEDLLCEGNTLTECGADGRSTVTASCALGCSAESRCLSFEPSNDLADALAMSEAEPDVVLPPATRVDTTTGTVQDPNGTLLEIASLLIAQDGGTSIRVFIARSWIIDDVSVAGTHAVAFVAHETIIVRGVLDASANGVVSGPGGQESLAACAGGATEPRPMDCDLNCHAEGAGGGGNATTGASGGGFTPSIPGQPGGNQVLAFAPLGGGCRGGNFELPAGPRLGGAGGGGVQLVAGTSVEFSVTGMIDVGGGGGESTGGGGSGGNVVIEAPTLRFEGSSTGIVANGGSGGGCLINGTDGTRTAFPAESPKCSPSSAGNGGTAASPPVDGQVKCPTGSCALNSFQGGGGGSVGQLLISTADGQFSANGSPTLSIAISNATLTPR